MDNGNQHVDKLMRELEAAKGDKKKAEPKPGEIDWKTPNDRDFAKKITKDFGVNL